MKKERKTVYELSPPRFIVPDGANPDNPLIFERDDSVPGLYRAEIKDTDLGKGETVTKRPKKPSESGQQKAQPTKPMGKL